MASFTDWSNITNINYTSTGALPPPQGVVPHFNDFAGHRGGIVVVCVIGIVLPTIFIWIRIWTKLRISKDMGWDDYTCCVAWVLSLAQPSLRFDQMRIGGDVHQWNVTLAQFSGWLHSANTVQIIYGPISALTRTSLLLQFLRIFVPMRTPRKLYNFTRLLILLNILFYTADTIATIFQCTPRRKIWEPHYPGHCTNSVLHALRTSVANVISDFLIAVLPVKSVWQLQIARKRKLYISAVFAPGLLACSCGVVRLVESILWLHTDDLTYHLSNQAYFVGAEFSFGIICGCLPVLPRFFSHYYPKLASKLFSRTPSAKEHRTPTVVSNSFYNAKHKAPWPGQSLDVPGPIGNYTELDDLSSRRGTKGRSVVIEGGLNHSRSTHENWSPETEAFVDLEIGPPNNAIQKTIRIETIHEI